MKKRMYPHNIFFICHKKYFEILMFEVLRVDCKKMCKWHGGQFEQDFKAHSYPSDIQYPFQIWLQAFFCTINVRFPKSTLDSNY